jgi:2-polyprenyl-6-hydroxyphenyl methylase/3-demethylubiquinone-9 3-methyltransferase
VTTAGLSERRDGPDAPRFAFGQNWQSYLRVLTEDRIAAAVASLEGMLGADRIAGATFLDVGSGSGLSSLAANRLGAARIHSFDFDRDSVACTEAVRGRHGSPRAAWTVEQGSALDDGYLASLGQWDIVYSWGVLHHTGDMWTAIDRVSRLVRPGGTLFIAIYNDQGPISKVWTRVKRLYNAGAAGKLAVLTAFVP